MDRVVQAASVSAAVRGRWARRLIVPGKLGLLAALCAALACGARTGPNDEGDGAYGEGGFGGAAYWPVGACAECDGSVVCTHCYIQAHEVTFRCVPGLPTPGDGCFGLGEYHVDQWGDAYTCYYCP